ncbi:MAG: pyruvate ferredoxin oxidoreductase [Deltaproteobacteria bacterium]|nr:pyruvate ferredoxin oxidoreductase [Candidatus Anaeroferrophillacea bacterium]
MTSQDPVTPARHVREMLLGSDAVAHGVRLCRPAVVSAYPITPQTHIIETLSEMVDRGELPAEFIKVESEMSAIAACLGAVSAGVRAFTATSSQGLAMMHEILHWVAGARLPLVMVNANRALGAPWNIWADQSDSLSQRDTGWLQLYGETAQEALDGVIIAYRVTEALRVPVMVMLDGFIGSHTMEPLFIPDPGLVDDYLPPYTPVDYLDPDNPLTLCAATAPDSFYELKKGHARAMERAFDVLDKTFAEFGDRFGRRYAAVETAGTDDAEILVLSTGALTGTVRVALDRLRRQGVPAGLLKLRLVRPFPRWQLRHLLTGRRRVIVLNRAVSYGAGGILTQELRAACCGMADAPAIHDVIVSLGGKEVYPETIEEIVVRADELSPDESVWRP